MIEIDFASESESIAVVQSCVVPTVGSVVNIRKKDWTVTTVYYAVDYADKTYQERTLRAIVQLEPKP